MLPRFTIFEPRIAKSSSLRNLALALIVLVGSASAAVAHDPDYTADFGRERCTFTTTGNHPYFPLWPGYVLLLEGEEEDDDGMLVDLSVQITVLPETETVDGVLTRVVEELETEDGELVEISRNFMAVCRETGDVWYFGEDVDDYEDGVIVGHEGAWKAGQAGAIPGVLMPGTPLLGARHFQEQAPGVAMDLAEITSLSETLDLPSGSFENLLYVVEGSALDPDDMSEKWYAPGIGLVKDEEVELVEVTEPACRPDATTHCLNHGRFKVQVDFEDFDGKEGDGQAILASSDSGEFWFFGSDNTEILVKVLDACDLPSFNSYWVFAAGLTNVEVTIEVTDTVTGITREYDNPKNRDFEPVLDTAAFKTCS